MVKQPWLIAHRGASGYAPENTLAAYRKAAELGALFIETDLHVTRDFQFVAIHDATLERTTNGRGSVRAHGLAQLRALDAGSWFAPEFSGERLPTLEEILQFVKSTDVGFYLEIKSEAAWGAHHSLVSSLRGAEEEARVIVISFDGASIEELRLLDATLMTGLLCDRAEEDMVERALHFGARQLLPRGDLVSAELVQRAHRSDLQVVTWTLNEPGEMRAAIAAGVDGIMTDYPDRLRDVLNER
jgi:glycerophosphoryl diester phosphodiesterase